MKNVVNIVLLLTILMTFSSCGYKPSSKYARKIVGEKVSTSVQISVQDPQNTMLLKDALDGAILEVFQTSLTSKKLATTHLNIKLKKIKYEPLAFDKDGFIGAYRTTLLLQIDRETRETKMQYLAKGTYDFSVASNAVITDNEKSNAIRYSAKKAINSFISQVTSQGIR